MQIKLSGDYFWRGIGSRIPLQAMQRMTVLFLSGLALACLIIGCERNRKSEDGNALHYQVRGVIRGVSPDRQTLEIQHENIPGFMPSMTMPFSARDRKEIAELRIGDAISFRMSVTDKDFWIDQVRKIDRNEVQVADPKPAGPVSAESSQRLREGDEMPVFSLTNQDGARIALDTFRGRPFVLTFIFTRCPVPNFCPRMSNNFAELQSAIKAGNEKLSKTRLLSVTLDPGFDSPQILKEYGAHLHFDPDVWTFATGDPKEIDALTGAFSVYRQTEGGTISHGLATALIDKDGHIEKIWRGNGWTPAEIISEIAR
jgi:protein SCO1